MFQPTLRSPRRGFTIVELLVTVGIILLLLGLLVPALRGVMSTGKMSQSMAKMRQVGLWMTSYSSDNNDLVLPSQFDYSGHQFPGKVRSVLDDDMSYGDPWQGTWVDILWVGYSDVKLPEMPATAPSFLYDAPSSLAYDMMPTWTANPFRSSAPSTRDFLPGDGTPLPYGTGAKETGVPGYFAANNFFNVDLDGAAPPFGTKDGYWSNAQLRRPSASIYLVDSLAGEVIAPDLLAWDPDPSNDEFQVDFRYTGSCIVLLLDGSVSAVLEYSTVDPVEDHPDRLVIEGYRINELEQP